MLKIVAVRAATAAEWDDTWAACSYATFYQSRDWCEVWIRYLANNARAAATHLTFSDGTAAIVPYMAEPTRHKLFSGAVLSPAGTFGGWVSRGALTGAHTTLLARWLLSRFDAITWRLNPYSLPDMSALKAGSIKDDVTSTLALTSDFDATFRTWSKGHKAAVAQARKAGVSIRQADGESDWRSYFEVYTDSLRRWGDNATSAYKWPLFELLRNLPAGRVRLWLAIHEEQIVAGALCLYAAKHVGYWHGAALEAAFALRPVNLLIYEAAKSAAADGYEWFDFNPSGKHEGVRAFKKSFGVAELPCPVITARSARFSLFQKAKRLIKN